MQKGSLSGLEGSLKLLHSLRRDTEISQDSGQTLGWKEWGRGKGWQVALWKSYRVTQLGQNYCQVLGRWWNQRNKSKR